jgi:hypothetical protein
MQVEEVEVYTPPGLQVQAASVVAGPVIHLVKVVLLLQEQQIQVVEAVVVLIME